MLRKVVKSIRQIATSVVNNQLDVFRLARHSKIAPNWSQLIGHFLHFLMVLSRTREMIKPNLKVKEYKFKTSISIKSYGDCRSGVNRHFPFNSLRSQSTSSNWFVCLQSIKKKTVSSFFRAFRLWLINFLFILDK